MTPPATPPPGPPGPESPHRSPDPRRRHRRVVAVAFGVSVVLHAVLVALYPLLLGPGDRAARSASSPDRPARPEGTELVRLVEVSDEELERPVEPENERQPVPEPPRARAPRAEAAGEPVEGEPAGGLTAAERVLATTPDARLLAPLSDDVVALSPEQIAQLQLAWALEELNDSAAALSEAARRARDWTFTDDDGRRWGVSSEGLHLGGITLPLPSFGAPYDPNAWKGSMDADLERAAGSAAAWETLEERARAIRERKDRERAERADTARGGGGGGRGNI